MRHRSLIIYLFIVSVLSGGFILLIKSIGPKGFLLINFYMLIPAIAAIITRLFFYDNKFRDANLRLGKLRHYLQFYVITIGIVILFYFLSTLFGAVSWDFSGATFIEQMSQQTASAGQSMGALPVGVTPQTMLIMAFISNLTIALIPGIIFGFGEEFGWRGFMFPQLYKIKPWVAFIIGGLIWFAWHIPIGLVVLQTQLTYIWRTILKYFHTSHSSYICLHLFCICIHKNRKHFCGFFVSYCL